MENINWEDYKIDISDEEFKKKREKYRKLMKDFNICKKYFRSIKPYVYCEICNEILEDIEINKEEIRNGLHTGLFVFKYFHTNPLADPEDPEDLSGKEHTTQIYIDNKYNVTGVRCYFGRELSKDEMGEGAMIPIIIKEAPPMAVAMGMLTQDEFNIMKMCDGNNTLQDVAELTSKTLKQLDKLMKGLKSKGLINLIQRS